MTIIMKPILRRTATATLIAVALSGCTGADLVVTRLRDDKAQAPLVGSLTYYLPRTAIDIAVSLTLTDCSHVIQDGKPNYTIKINRTVAAMPVVEADPAYRYAISYSDAESWEKEVDFKIGLNSNKTLSSFNGQINDQVGATAVAVVSTAVSIFGAAIIPEVPNLSSAGAAAEGVAAPQFEPGGKRMQVPAPKYPEICTPEAIRTLDDIKAQNAIIAANKKLTDNATILSQQNARIVEAENVIATDTKNLTRTGIEHWVPEATAVIPVVAQNQAVSYTLKVDELIKPWLNTYGLNDLAGDPQAENWKQLWDKLLTPIIFQIEIDRTTQGDPTNGQKWGPENSNDLSNPGGLVLRDPALGTLRVCSGVCKSETAGQLADTTDDVIPRQSLVLPQFGQIRVYPQHSALAENANLVIQANADGSIASAEYHSFSNAATEVTSVGTAATGYGTAITNRNSAVTAVTTAQTTQMQLSDTINKALSDCYTDVTTIVNSGGTPVPCQ